MSRGRFLSALLVGALLSFGTANVAYAKAGESKAVTALRRLTGDAPGRGRATARLEGLGVWMDTGRNTVASFTLPPAPTALQCAEPPKRRPEDRWWLLEGAEPVALRFTLDALTAWRYDPKQRCTVSWAVFPTAPPVRKPTVALGIERDCMAEETEPPPEGTHKRVFEGDIYEELPGDEAAVLTLEFAGIYSRGLPLYKREIAQRKDEGLCLEPSLRMWREPAGGFTLHLDEIHSDYVGADTSGFAARHTVFRSYGNGRARDLELLDRESVEIGKWCASGDRTKRSGWRWLGRREKLVYEAAYSDIDSYDGDDGECRLGTASSKRSLLWRLEIGERTKLDLYRIPPTTTERAIHERCSADALRRLAQRELKAGRLGKAQTVYRLACDARPDDPQLLADLGWAALRAKDLKAAREASTKALALTKKKRLRGAIRYNLGRVAEAAGELGEAREHYRRSLADRPNETVQKRLDGLR